MEQPADPAKSVLSEESVRSGLPSCISSREWGVRTMAAKGIRFALFLAWLIVWAYGGAGRLVAREPPSNTAAAILASATDAPKSVMTGPVTPAPVAAAPITPPPAMPGFATSAPLTAVPATPGPVMPVPDGAPVGAGISDVSDAHGGPDDCQNAMSCGDGCCSPAGRFWFQGDYLLWWTKGTNLPPLVTTSDDQSGVLGPGTTVLFGDTTAEDRARSRRRSHLGHVAELLPNLGHRRKLFHLGAALGRL